MLPMALFSQVNLSNLMINGEERQWNFTTQASGIHDVYLTYENPTFPLKTEQFAIFFDIFSFIPSLPGKGLAGYDKIKKIFWDLVTAEVPTTPVMMENPSWQWRTTQVFERGNFRTLGKVSGACCAQFIKFCYACQRS